MLRRMGTKAANHALIKQHFPKHESYIEPFFGAGGMFFNKPLAKHNTVNDLDSDVFNLFMVVLNQLNEFTELFKQMPIHEDLMNHWKINQEIEPVKKALRFVFLSNYTLFGAMGTLASGVTRDGVKAMTLKEFKKIQKLLENVKFFNRDFKVFLKILEISEPHSTFIYADPPYIVTNANYLGFTENDSKDLFDSLQATGCKWAMSEFNNPFILEQAKERGLNVIIIGERRNINNRRTEILVTNYKTPIKSLF